MTRQKNDAPKFLISANPMARPKVLYLTHTQSPFFVAEIKEFDQLTKCVEHEATIAIGGRTSVNNKFYVVDPVFIIHEGETPGNTQENADKMAGLFRRAADWVRAYMIYVKPN
jgi:hypothetical protein